MEGRNRINDRSRADGYAIYGGVQGGRLKEYERPKQEYEALLVEQSFSDGKRRINQHASTNDGTMETPLNQGSKATYRFPWERRCVNQ